MTGIFSKTLFGMTLAVSMTALAGELYAESIERDYTPRRGASRGNSNSSFIFGGLFGSDRRPAGDIKVVRQKPIRIFTYKPDAMVTLQDTKLKQPRSPGPVFAESGGAAVEVGEAGPLDDSLAQTIFTSLKNGSADTRVTKAQKKAIIAFYKERTYKSVWTDMDGLTEKGAELLAILSRADYEGLDASQYLPEILGTFTDSLDAIESDLSLLARLEIDLTAKAIRYGMDASGGRITPKRLSGFHDLTPPKAKPETILKMLAETNEPSVYLAGLHPKSKAYNALKAELAKELGREQEEYQVPISAGGLIRPGDMDERVALVRKRLIKSGHYQAPAADDQNQADAASDLYDEQLLEAVRAFQKDNSLRPDGIIGRRTIAKFNGKKRVNKKQALVFNMERLRWLPQKFPDEYVFANQAAFDLRVFRNSQQIWKTKVVVGKPRHQTSIFMDEMETVVFNPYWGVPQSIMRNEMLPKLINNPGYLDRAGYEVYNSRGRRVSSSNVDWWDYSGAGVLPFAVRQPPGRRNALGQIKFLFPNKHAIYMHDTPSKHLFERKSRAYSHGCVRVYKPRIFAEKILGWDQDRIASKIAAGKNAKVTLNRKIPVYLTYFTAWPDETGKIRYFNDVYGRDQRLELAFGSTRLALK